MEEKAIEGRSADEALEPLIHSIRSLRVILDADLAKAVRREHKTV
jgi:hypothetical protein